jgi:hypothetical protein
MLRCGRRVAHNVGALVIRQLCHVPINYAAAGMRPLQFLQGSDGRAGAPHLQTLHFPLLTTPRRPPLIPGTPSHLASMKLTNDGHGQLRMQGTRENSWPAIFTRHGAIQYPNAHSPTKTSRNTTRGKKKQTGLARPKTSPPQPLPASRQIHLPKPTCRASAAGINYNRIVAVFSHLDSHADGGSDWLVVLGRAIPGVESLGSASPDPEG